MTARTLPRRRTTTFAVSTAQPVNWKTRGACRSKTNDVVSAAKTADDFFSTAKAAKARARTMCARCPVIAECLNAQRGLDEGTYRWGIAGGLDGEQRNALEMEEALGNRPNLEMARLLVSPRWLFRLLELESQSRSLGDLVRALREEGLLVDEVTARVAVWWSGGEGSRLSWDPADRRGLQRQILDDCMGAVVALRAAGARQADVAAYLGSVGKHGNKAVSGALKAAEATAAAGAVEVAA